MPMPVGRLLVSADSVAIDFSRMPARRGYLRAPQLGRPATRQGCRARAPLCPAVARRHPGVPYSFAISLTARELARNSPVARQSDTQEAEMARAGLLWVLGIPI